jgi:hypothetical protein
MCNALLGLRVLSHKEMCNTTVYRDSRFIPDGGKNDLVLAKVSVSFLKTFTLQ